MTFAGLFVGQMFVNHCQFGAAFKRPINRLKAGDDNEEARGQGRRLNRCRSFSVRAVCQRAKKPMKINAACRAGLPRQAIDIPAIRHSCRAYQPPKVVLPISYKSRERAAIAALFASQVTPETGLFEPISVDSPLSGQKSLGGKNAVTTLLKIVFRLVLYFRIQSVAFLEIDGDRMP
jgi:hypothetical protein